MKRLFTFFTISSILFFSCKKDKADESFHLSCKIDGQTASFNTASFAGHLTNEAGTGFTFGGLTAATASGDALGFVIIDMGATEKLGAGTYADSSTKFEILTTFTTGADGHAYEAGSTVFQQTNESSDIANHLKVSITSVTNETVRGTFSGDFFLEGDPTGAKKTITNGDFYLKLQEQQ